jgi:hypothetical protein
MRLGVLWDLWFEVEVRQVDLNDCTRSPQVCSVIVKVVGGADAGSYRDLVIRQIRLFSNTDRTHRTQRRGAVRFCWSEMDRKRRRTRRHPRDQTTGDELTD